MTTAQLASFTAAPITEGAIADLGSIKLGISARLLRGEATAQEAAIHEICYRNAAALGFEYVYVFKGTHQGRSRFKIGKARSIEDRRKIFAVKLPFDIGNGDLRGASGGQAWQVIINNAPPGTTASENIDTLMAEGDYLVTLNANPGTFPPVTLPGSYANLSVRGTANDYTQTLIYTQTKDTPHRVWTRMYYYGGWTQWRELTFDWTEAVLTNSTNLNATTLLKRGVYLMGTGGSAPSGLPAGYDTARTGILNVSVYNSVAFEMLSNMYSSNAWIRTHTSGIAPTAWAKVGPEAFYKKVLEEADDIDALHAEGAYVVNSTLSTGTYPVGMPTYGVLEVQGSGLFVVQTMTAIQGSGARPRAWVRNWQTSFGQSDWVETTNPLVPEPLDPAQPLYGKKAVFLGDSITQGLMGSLLDQFPSYVATRTGAECVNFGVGGTQMATHTTAPDYGPFSFWALAEAFTTGVWTTQDATAATIGHTATVAAMKVLDWTTVDFVVVAYGQNDRSNGVSVGTDTSTNNGDFYGAMRNGLTDLLTKWPHLQVLMVCPYDRLSATDTIAPFVAAIQDVCENEFRLPYIDLYRSSGISNFTKSVYLHSDELHPSRVGYEYLGNKIGGWMLSVV